MDLPANHKTYFCLGYEKDFENAYAFYCARYENISIKNFLKLGITEFNMKIGSIPENEPLYKIIKSRIINVSQIKDENQRNYWNDLKNKNKIPSEYLSTREVLEDLQRFSKERKKI